MTSDGTGRPGPLDRLAEEGAALIRERCDVVPEVAVVLGSGLGGAVATDTGSCHEFSFEALPGFPEPSVPGHPGRLVMGSLYGVGAAVFHGRVHFYEGRGMEGATLIPRLAAELGARILILTNAAGGLDPALPPGRLVLVSDHINLMGHNPLLGWRFPDGIPAFVHLAPVYDPALGRRAHDVARQRGIPLVEGVYVAVSGPSFETGAEVRFLRATGAHVVGMSTVPEAVAGRALGLRVVALSCVTNSAGEPGSHGGVLSVATEAAGEMGTILTGLLSGLGGDPGREDRTERSRR